MRIKVEKILFNQKYFSNIINRILAYFSNSPDQEDFKNANWLFIIIKKNNTVFKIVMVFVVIT